MPEVLRSEHPHSPRQPVIPSQTLYFRALHSGQIRNKHWKNGFTSGQVQSVTVSGATISLSEAASSDS